MLSTLFFQSLAISNLSVLEFTIFQRFYSLLLMLGIMIVAIVAIIEKENIVQTDIFEIELKIVIYYMQRENNKRF